MGSLDLQCLLRGSSEHARSESSSTLSTASCPLPDTHGLDSHRENLALVRNIEAFEHEHENRWGALQASDSTGQFQSITTKAQELDLCFLLDGTTSMEASFDLVKNRVASVAANIKDAYPKMTLRVALVVYRDYDIPMNRWNMGCQFTADFQGPRSKFIRAISSVRTRGGKDVCEDVFSGLEWAAKLKWKSQNRVLVHICDAPCHGQRFHDIPLQSGCIDLYPKGDRFRRDIGDLLRKLQQHHNVNQYLFCHLNNSTKKMMQEFRNVVGEGWIREQAFSDLEQIPHTVVDTCCTTIHKTMRAQNLSNYGDQPQKDGSRSRKIDTSRPNWETISYKVGHVFQHRTYAIEDLLNMVRNRESLQVDQQAASVLIQIVERPFSQEGEIRVPYHARVHRDEEQPRPAVVKRFRTRNRSVEAVHSEDQYLNQMEVQTIAAHLAQEFNREIQYRQLPARTVEFTPVYILKVDSDIYNMESYMEGEWIRFSNNNGYVNTNDYVATLQAFTHWTYHRSNGLLMVTDLQGVVQTNSDGGSGSVLLNDPAVHCIIDTDRFTETNGSAYGFYRFFQTHECNHICKHLGLVLINRLTSKGTQVFRRNEYLSGRRPQVKSALERDSDELPSLLEDDLSARSPQTRNAAEGENNELPNYMDDDSLGRTPQ